MTQHARLVNLVIEPSNLQQARYPSQPSPLCPELRNTLQGPIVRIFDQETGTAVHVKDGATAQVQMEECNIHGGVEVRCCNFAFRRNEVRREPHPCEAWKLIRAVQLHGSVAVTDLREAPHNVSPVLPKACERIAQ